MAQLECTLERHNAAGEECGSAYKLCGRVQDRKGGITCPTPPAKGNARWVERTVATTIELLPECSRQQKSARKSGMDSGAATSGRTVAL